MQNNATSSSAKLFPTLLEKLQKYNINGMVSNSPDINEIENLWFIFKTNLYEKRN